MKNRLNQILKIADNPTVLDGLVDLFGKYKYGASRVVYFPEWDDSIVIKISFGDISSNVYEHDIWNHVVEADLYCKNWLAPVIMISGNGSVLIQSRTDPITSDQVRGLPHNIPFWLSDLKIENYGWLEGRFVCHDYGNHRLLNQLKSKRTRQAFWWSADEKMQQELSKINN